MPTNDLAANVGKCATIHIAGLIVLVTITATKSAYGRDMLQITTTGRDPLSMAGTRNCIWVNADRLTVEE